MRIEEVVTYDDFVLLKDNWAEVLRRCDHSIFSTWEWLSTWWKHFGKEKNLRVLIALEKEQKIGIAPLMLSKYNFLKIGTLRKIEFIGSPHSDYNALIFPKEKKDCLKLFLDQIMKFSDWDLLELRDINEESISASVLKDIYCSHTPKLELNVSSLCPYINLPTSIKIFLNNLSRNKRKNMRKRLKKLQRKYKVELKTQHDFASIKESMEIFFRLHQKRWKSKGEPGAFASKAFRDFHMNLAEIFNEKDWLALYFLTVNDEPIAAIYSFDYNLKKYGYLTGFDPDFGYLGVSNLLKIYVIEECIKKGFKEYDLTRGSEPYKLDWATNIRKNFVARMTNRGWRPPLLSWHGRAHSWIRNRFVAS